MGNINRMLSIAESMQKKYGADAYTAMIRIIDYAVDAKKPGIEFTKDYLVLWLYKQHFATHDNPVDLRLFMSDFDSLSPAELSAKYGIWVPVCGTLFKYNKQAAFITSDDDTFHTRKHIKTLIPASSSV